MNTLASRFSRNAVALRSHRPLSNDEIAQVAPSILAQTAHESRSARYSYIPTINVLDALRKEGFQPFMVCQTRVRDDDRRAYTKHLVRMRHVGDIAGREANEIILLNSHDGSSSFQLVGGCFRFVCQDVVGDVIEGAFRMLDSFEAAAEQREGMMASVLDEGVQTAFARAALALRYDEDKPAPVTERQLLAPRRVEDRAPDLWSTFSRVQENLIRGGLHGRNASGRSITTRPVTAIDQNIRLNRALWVLAHELRRLRG